MRKKFWPAGGGSVLTGSGGEGAQRGGRRMEAEREREGEVGGPWRVVEQRASGAAAARPRRARAACCCVTMDRRG
jgi:hypothetical protein